MLLVIGQSMCYEVCLSLQIAIEGCCHGELDKIYDAILELESRDNIKVDLLLCCGDFQVMLCV